MQTPFVAMVACALLRPRLAGLWRLLALFVLAGGFAGAADVLAPHFNGGHTRGARRHRLLADEDETVRFRANTTAAVAAGAFPIAAASVGIAAVGMVARGLSALLQAQTLFEMNAATVAIKGQGEELRAYITDLEGLLEFTKGDADMRLLDAMRKVAMAIIRESTEEGMKALIKRLMSQYDNHNRAPPNVVSLFKAPDFPSQRTELAKLLQMELDITISLDRDLAAAEKANVVLEAVSPNLGVLVDMLRPVRPGITHIDQSGQRFRAPAKVSAPFVRRVPPGQPIAHPRVQFVNTALQYAAQSKVEFSKIADRAVPTAALMDMLGDDLVSGLSNGLGIIDTGLGTEDKDEVSVNDRGRPRCRVLHVGASRLLHPPT
jgi:hypothetical protein